MPGGTLHLRPHKRIQDATGIRLVLEFSVNRCRARDLALGVIGIGFASKGNRSNIAFAIERKHAKQTRRLPNTKHHDTGGQRVKRARMAHTTNPQGPPHARNDIVRRAPEGLVDGK